MYYKKLKSRLVSMESHKEGLGYVSVKPIQEHKQIIFDWLSLIGIDDYIEDLHTTLMYDAANPIIDRSSCDPNRLFDAQIVGVKLLGEVTSKYRACVLVLSSPDLSKRHEELKALGMKSSYPEYIPHISLKYVDTSIEKTVRDNLYSLQRKLPNVVMYNESWEVIKEEL